MTCLGGGGGGGNPDVLEVQKEKQLGFAFCSPGLELLANSAKATGGEDV